MRDLTIAGRSRALAARREAARLTQLCAQHSGSTPLCIVAFSKRGGRAAKFHRAELLDPDSRFEGFVPRPRR